jgi:hypothetical protein
MSVPASDGTRGAGSVVVVDVVVVGGDVVVVLVDVVLVVLVVDVVVLVVGAGTVVLVEVTTDVVVGVADELVGDVLGSAALSPPSLQAATIATSASTCGIRRARRGRGATAPMMPWHRRDQGSYRALNLLRQCSQRHRSS